MHQLVAGDLLHFVCFDKYALTITFLQLLPVEPPQSDQDEQDALHRHSQ